MTTFDRDNKDTLTQRIITTALWFTDATEKLTDAMIAFDARFDQAPGDSPYPELFRMDTEIQQLRRVAMYADDRFQTALEVYCKRFNSGADAGLLTFQNQAFAFWKQDGRYNMTMSEAFFESKIIYFSSAVRG